jgi:hypothetical protein
MYLKYRLGYICDKDAKKPLLAHTNQSFTSYTISSSSSSNSLTSVEGVQAYAFPWPLPLQVQAQQQPLHAYEWTWPVAVEPLTFHSAAGGSHTNTITAATDDRSRQLVNTQRTRIVDELKSCDIVLHIPLVILTLIASYATPGPYLFLIGQGVSWLDISLLDTPMATPVTVTPTPTAITAAAAVTVTSTTASSSTSANATRTPIVSGNNFIIMNCNCSVSMCEIRPTHF